MTQRNLSVSVEKTYFHSILSDKEFEHLPVAQENSYLDNKKLFLGRNFRSGRTPEIHVEYQWSGKMHFGYWDKKLSRFTIVEFAK
jgi:hypothetical protein